MRYAMSSEVAEAVAAALVAQGVTARVYPSDRQTYGCMVRVRVGKDRPPISIYTEADVPGALAKLAQGKVALTVATRLEQADDFREGEGYQGRPGPAGLQGPRDHADPFVKR